MKINKKVGYGLISLGRKAFVGTPIQKMKITDVIYTRLFRAMYKDGDAQTIYKGVKLTLPTKDSTVVPSILGGYFESLELDIFKEAAKLATNVIDVGGNIGLFSIIAAKQNRLNGNVFAFEPVPENIEYFQKNVKDNKINNIDLIQKAVGASKGKLDIFLSKDNIGIHSASKTHSRGKEKITVPMTSVDLFVKEKGIKSVDILKIDVEGYDGFVLKGATKTIKEHRPTIFIEYDPEALKNCDFAPEQFVKLLFSRYKYCLRVDELKHSVGQISSDELLALPVFCNENLVFTNNKELATRK